MQPAQLDPTVLDQGLFGIGEEGLRMTEGKTIGRLPLLPGAVGGKAEISREQGWRRGPEEGPTPGDKF